MELRNYVVVQGSAVDDVARAVTAELAGKRGWEVAGPDAVGAHVVEIWPAAGGLTVVDLTTWEESDARLGKAVSAACDTTAAVYFYASVAEEANELSVFSSGRKVRSEKSALASLVKEDGWWDFTPIPGAEPITLMFRDGRSERVNQVMSLVKTHFEPVLQPLSLARGRIAPDYPTIDLAVGYGRRLAGDASLWVRYTFPKDSAALKIRQDIWTKRGSNFEAVYRGGETRVLMHAKPDRVSALLDRDCRLLAAQFVTLGAAGIAEAVPSLAADIDAARATAAWRRAADDLESLERTKNVAVERGAEWIEGTVSFRGAQMLVVQAAGSRFTFKLDTSGLPATKEVAVGELWEDWIGNVAARKLRMGDRVVSFDYDGRLKAP